ncbi:LysR family transcriptional regulator [Stutzerimonas chloritidismutans]|uniref:LysR family transcriptional regulator n=1 Tax=Stutzerimonas chloritidismutans TaxID=203192 RepID=UPI003F173A91
MSSIADVSMRQLRYFAAAAEAGQFSQAALNVHVSQSAITTAVSQLESQLKVRLFDRHPYGVDLTAEGHKFYQHVRHVLDTLQDALSEPAFLSQNVEGCVRVGATYTVLGYFLPNLLARFKRSYPQVEIDLVDMPRDSIEEGVESGELDLGLSILSNSDGTRRFERHVLIRSRRQLWLSSDHPLLTVESVSLQDIASHAYIMPTVDEGEASSMRYWQNVGLTPKVEFKTSSMEALRGLVAHGFGVTILSDMLYRPWSLEGRKIEIRAISDIVPVMELGLIWPPDAPIEPAAEAFRQFLIYTSST